MQDGVTRSDTAVAVEVRDTVLCRGSIVGRAFRNELGCRGRAFEADRLQRPIMIARRVIGRAGLSRSFGCKSCMTIV